MLKQTLIIATLLTFSSCAFAADVKPVKADAPKPCVECKCKKTPPTKEQMEKKREEFAARLQLSEEQKAQAKVIHEKGMQEMKPVMEKIKAEKCKIKAVKADTKLSDEKKAAKIKPIKEEMKKCMQEAKAIRQKNAKEFEAILTDAQKQELAKMKEEGRQKFEARKKELKGKCPCNTKTTK